MTGFLRLVSTIVMLIASTQLYAQPCDCITTGNCPVNIFDNATFQGTINVQVDGPNDLGACPLVSICFSIEHSWIGDLSATLTSPSGLNYIIMGDANNNFGGCGTNADNIDVCIITGAGNPLTDNTEYICNTGPCVFGTCCLTGQWTVPCNGVSDPVSFGQQAPNCDLNDFNVPGDPANGTWTLTINDVCSEDVGYLLNFTLEFACGTISCTVCNADGGTLDAPNAASCFGDPSLNLDLPPNYNGNHIEPNQSEYAYGYVLSQNGTIISINPTSDFSATPVGNYQVCGLSYALLATGDIQTLIGMDLTTAQNMLSGTTAPFCANFSEDCIDLIIGPPVLPTVIDTLVCLGDCIEVGNETVCSSGTVTLESWLGCDSVIQVIMVPIVIPPSPGIANLCPGECLEVNGDLYCPPGPHSVVYTSWTGCDSTVLMEFQEIPTEAVILPENPAELSCTNNTLVLDGSTSLPANTDYSWLATNGFSSNQPTIAVSQPGTYTLTVINNAVYPACESSMSVVVGGNLDGPDLQVNDSSMVICLGDTLDLATLDIEDLNNTNADITFHSSTPATAVNELPSTLVSPGDSTVYYILATSGACTDEDSVVVAVNPVPSANFTLDAAICLDSFAVVTFNGTSDSATIFNWNFGGGTASPGTGPGPHQVEWLSGGIKTITLVTEENGCTSEQAIELITVDAPLNAPVINCIPDNNSINYFWDPVAGANGYNVTVAIGPAGSMTSDTSYLVTGLNPNQQSSIFVEAVSANSCGNTSTQITCTAQDCPGVIVTIEPVDDICLDGNTAPLPLMVSQSGGDGSGVYTWSGPGVNPLTGMFNPANANIGSNNIVVTYEEGTCLYNTSANINVFPVPTADFTVASPACIVDGTQVEYTGNATTDAAFIWDFGGGTATPGTGPGPHTVTWNDSGTQTISLTVEENNCTSETEIRQIEMEAPLPAPSIACNATTSSVEFTWNNIPGADEFQVNVTSGGNGLMTSDTSILFDGLNAGDIIGIEVIAVSSGACGNSSAQADCTANDCPDVTIDIQSVADICLDANAAPFNMMASVAGNAGAGELTWSGTGITNEVNGTFDATVAQAGSHTIIATYAEGDCSYTENITVNVFELPPAVFDIQNAACEAEDITVTYSGTAEPGMLYTWDFGDANVVSGTDEGPYTLNWADAGMHVVSLIVEDANGCISEDFGQNVQVEAPLSVPNISCSSTTSSVSFSWPDVPGAADYEVVVLSGQNGTFNPPNNFEVTNLNPDDEVTIQLIITGNGICPPVTAEETCIAVDCPPLAIDIEPAGTVCLGSTAPFDLVANVNGNGTGMWSGNGIADPMAGTFDPALAGEGSHLINYAYTDGNCEYDASTIVEVFAVPLADFTMASNICLSDEAIVTYTGDAVPGAIYTWDVGSAIASPGTGQGPQTLSFDTPGDYSISLTVEENGCISQPFSQNIQVDEELAAPVISCNVSTETVEFTWDPVPGATDYEINVLSGHTGTQDPGGSYLVTGLNPGDEVTIQLVVSGNTACPPAIAEASCTANDCPGVVIDLLPVQPICFDPSLSSFVLEATLAGGSGNGSGSWSGNGIVDAITGLFDPAVAGTGTHTLTYTYIENANCSFTENMVVTIVAPPDADAGTDVTLTCLDGETDAEIGGTATAASIGITYNWSADFGSFPGDSTILHPIVSLPGIYTLTVTDTEWGCSATDEIVIGASQEIPVIDVSLQPISCHGANDGAIAVTSIDGGIEPYMFSLNGSPFTSSGTYLQLEPGVYELTVMDGNGCQNMLVADIQQPQDVDVELVVYVEGNNVIRLGESVEMEGVVTVPEDSLDLIAWEPADIVECDTCLVTSASPLQTTTFSITVEDNGCSDSDAVTIFINKDREVFVPNAFTPNGDGVNDRFVIYAGDHVSEIKSFLVFDRWGETVSEFYEFAPNDPNWGWTGTYRGEHLNSGVFTWFAEVEFIDGSIVVFEGSVTLVH